MAVDTRDERFSLINMTLPFGRTLHTPDGTIGGDDKQFFLLLYVGILWGVPVVVVVPGGPGKKKVERLPKSWWYEEKTRRAERIEREDFRKADLAAFRRRQEEDQRAIAREVDESNYRLRLMMMEEKIDRQLEQDKRDAARATVVRKQRLRNLAKAKVAKERKAEGEERLRQQRLKNLKKARAAKKRKRKKKK